MKPPRRRTRTAPPNPRDAAEAQGFDTGSRAVEVVIEDVAVGTRTIIKRARVASPLARMSAVTPGMLVAATRFATYFEHMEAGIGLGAPETAAERVQEPRRGDGLGVALLPQERALAAAARYGQGCEAIGVAAMPVVAWVVLAGASLESYAKRHRMRETAASRALVAALERLAEAYECG